MPLPFFVPNQRGTRDDGIARDVDNWRLVMPDKYPHELVDSFCAVTFNLIHYEIGQKDVFVAKVVNIRKMRDVGGAVHVVDTPVKKRKAVLDLLTDGPPRNKRRV